MCSWIRKQVQDDGSLAFAAGSVPKQLVDSGLGAGLRVHPLDDDGAVAAGSGRAVGKRLAGKRARNHHCIAGHAAREDLARRTAENRTSEVYGESGSVREAVGGRRISKKKNTTTR